MQGAHATIVRASDGMPVRGGKPSRHSVLARCRAIQARCRVLSRRRGAVAAVAMACMLGFSCAAGPACAVAAFASGQSNTAAGGVPLAAVNTHGGKGGGSESESRSEGKSASLESAAQNAEKTGRKVAMSLIGVGLAVAAIVLAFKRDFREAAVVFAVGLACVLLATDAGIKLLEDTITTIVGS